MSKLENDILLRTLNGESVERPPIWLMRQAGRILPEYRAVRASMKGFVDLVTTPERAAEVTIQPVDILNVDAAIIFSDILVIPEAMGLPYELIEKKGPYFPETIKTADQISKLSSGVQAASKLDYVFEALQITKKELNNRVPLIGFSGAPWTLMSYMIEGQGSKTFSKAKSFLYREPELARALISKITNTIIAYLKLKIENGADVVQLFDSWSGVLNREIYNEFFLEPLQRIKASITEVPLIIFLRGSHYLSNELKELNADCLGLDWTIEMKNARRFYGPNQVLQGNLDPCALYAPLSQIEDKAKALVRDAGPRHIFNLGHGVYPDTPLDSVKCLINTVKNISY